VNPLEAAALIIALFLPLAWLVRRELAKLENPDYLRAHGVVIVLEEVLNKHSAPIGRYMERPIWGSVTFLGMVYRFDRVAGPREKEKIGRGELYLEPGIIYITD
jgi:hypothetical protein